MEESIDDVMNEFCCGGYHVPNIPLILLSGRVGRKFLP
jgi:hypothetical protein